MQERRKARKGKIVHLKGYGKEEMIVSFARSENDISLMVYL